MAHQVIYQAFGRTFNDVWIGGTKSSIIDAILDICSTAQIKSITPTNHHKDELEKTHHSHTIEGMDVSIYRQEDY